jgi:hypothetical protein
MYLNRSGRGAKASKLVHERDIGEVIRDASFVILDLFVSEL